MEEIKLNELNVDKKNGIVNYNDEKHIYWDDSNNKYISVTTLIGKYEQHFDKEFWSKYKALERLLGEDVFKMEKSRLLKTKKFDNTILQAYDLDSNDLINTQNEILLEWDEKNKIACERGTAIHAKMENQFYTGKKNYSLKQFGIGGKFECRPHDYNLDLINGVYPEYLAYIQTEDGVNLAGQVDLIIKEGNNVIILDWKTNRKLDKKSGFDTSTRKNIMMKPPMNHLMDCNFMHYTIQLSTYAWMIEKNNPDLKVTRLMILHFDHDGNSEIHEVEYIKNDVEKLLKHYAKELKKEELKNKRKKIEF